MATDPFPSFSWTTQVFPGPARAQEAGLKPLKASQRICFNPNQVVRGSVKLADARYVEPGSVFMPVSAAERRELLTGEYPAATEPSAAEVAAFG
jgi:hypothetical protein